MLLNSKTPIFRHWAEFCSKAVLTVCAIGFLFTTVTNAQSTFNSGSTGGDGAFAPSANQTLQVPENGIFNFTTVNIPSGVTVTFTPNTRNTPVTILASGDVTIAGIISVNGENGLTNGASGRGGPGGFKGGTGGFNSDFLSGTNGDGRGGGFAGTRIDTNSGAGGGGGFATAGATGGYSAYPHAAHGFGGAVYGTASLQPLVGGSGGGGSAAIPTARGTGGGGGGGAILIASSGTITLSGAINAKGGVGGVIYHGTTGGGGSGGAVRLISNTITGAGTFDVRGGTGGGIQHSGSPGGTGGNGYIRVETYNFTTFNPVLNSVPLSLTTPNPVFASSNIQLRIASIGGVSTPLNAAGSLQGPSDVVLSGNLPNPVEIGLQTAGVPLGTIVQITVTPASGARTVVQSTPLVGAVDNATATASVTLPRGTSVITATVTMDLTASNLEPLFIEGERVKQIEVAAVFGGKPQIVYLTASGKRLIR